MANWNIFGGYDKRQNVTFNGQDVINLFIINSPTGKKKLAYVATPGLLLNQIVNGAVPCREFLNYQVSDIQNILIGVFGSSVYRFDTNYNATFIGSVGTSSGYISIVPNNNGQIGFVDGEAGYTYTVSTNTFATITDAGFPPNPLNLGFLDGFGIIPSGNSVEFQISAFNDFTKWNAFDEALIQSYPGFNVGVGVVNRRIHFFKNASCDIWYNNGSADFPFRPDRNSLFNIGCRATQSIREAFGYLFWLSNDEAGASSVYVTDGSTPRRVSTDSIDDLIATFVRPDDMDAYIYKENGHILYQMSWTTDDVTLFYDLQMDKWYRKEMLKHIPQLGVPYSGKVRHLTSCHAFFNGQHVVGSYKDSSIYFQSRAYPDNAGEPMKRQFVTGHLFDEDYKKILLNKVHLDMQQGIGQSGNGTGVYTDPDDDELINPQVYLSLSRDGGESYGNEIPAPIGKIGETRVRTIWRKKGIARDFVGIFTIYAPLPNICILGAATDLRVLAS